MVRAGSLVRELDPHGHGRSSIGRDLRSIGTGQPHASTHIVIRHEGRDSRPPAISLLDTNIRIGLDVGTPAGQRAVAADDPRTRIIEDRRDRDSPQLPGFSADGFQFAYLRWAHGTEPGQTPHSRVEQVAPDRAEYPELSLFGASVNCPHELPPCQP